MVNSGPVYGAGFVLCSNVVLRVRVVLIYNRFRVWDRFLGMRKIKSVDLINVTT